MKLKFIRKISTGEITRSIEQPLIFGTHNHLDDDGNILSEYEYLTQSEIDSIIFPEEKENKIKLAKLLRDKNLTEATRETITYSATSQNRSFKVSQLDINLFNSIIYDLQNLIDSGESNPTRGWTDADGERLQLNIDDFKSLRRHINTRDDLEYEQYELKKSAINSLETLDEVRAFDINQVI